MAKKTSMISQYKEQIDIYCYLIYKKLTILLDINI